jgi:hypothetical protein
MCICVGHRVKFVAQLAFCYFDDFSETSKPRGPPKASVQMIIPGTIFLCELPFRYITGLEVRLQQMEELLRQVHSTFPQYNHDPAVRG